MSVASTATAFQVHAADNVATLLGAADAGSELSVIGPSGKEEIAVREPIALGHKIALAPIAENEPVVKYGVPIGLATCRIERGAWVHLHNCRSRLDERSNSFDVFTGEPTDHTYA